MKNQGALALAAFVLGALPLPATEVKVQIPATTVPLGTPEVLLPVQVDVPDLAVGDEDGGLFSILFTIDYDEEILSALGVELEGTDGQALLDGDWTSIDEEEGTIRADLVFTPALPVGEKLTVAFLRFAVRDDLEAGDDGWAYELPLVFLTDEDPDPDADPDPNAPPSDRNLRAMANNFMELSVSAQNSVLRLVYRNHIRIGSVVREEIPGILRVPILVTNLEPLSSFSVGVDYDEEILSASGWEHAEDMPLRASFDGGAGFGVFGVRVNFHENEELEPGVEQTVLWLQFNLLAPAIGERLELVADPPSCRVNGVEDPYCESGALLIVPPSFIRGDVDLNRILSLDDALTILLFFFREPGAVRLCFDAADLDDDGIVTLSDAIFLLGLLFRQDRPPPPPPFPEPGSDPTEDGLDCRFFQSP